MSNQSVETSIQTEFVPDAEGKIEPQTSEDKFFGVKTEINKEDQTEDLNVEVVEEQEAEAEELEQQSQKSEPEAKEEPVTDEQLDQEISDYSKRAGDRINKIKYVYHEEKRQREEAVKQLKSILTENQRLQKMVEEGGKYLNQQATNNALFARQEAEAAFKKAYDEGDAEAMTKAQSRIAQATIAEQQAPTYAQNVQAQISQQIPQQPQQPVMDADMEAWSRNNSWFMGNEPLQREMTSYALHVDETLRNKGISAENNPKQYYDSVDAELRLKFPNYFGVTQQEPQVIVEEVPEEKRQPSNVVAPATRNSGSNNNPRSVKLTRTQVKLARQLGITPEKYANQLLKDKA